MIVAEGPLIWPVTDTGWAATPSVTQQQVLDAQELATEWLWSLTARRFGTRVCYDRPQTTLPRTFLRDSPSWLMSVYGYSRGWPYDADPRTGQTSARQIYELEQDAQSITQIQGWPAPGVTDPVFAPVVSPSVYRLEGNFLVRQDGGIWPVTQNLIAELGQPDTWQVTYVRGVPVPLAGQRAAGLITAQFLKAFCGSGECKLPFNVTNATRSGVTITRDVLKAIKTTGIGEVDQWVATVNPNGLMMAPTVWTPDLPRKSGPYLGSYAGGSSTVLP